MRNRSWSTHVMKIITSKQKLFRSEHAPGQLSALLGHLIEAKEGTTLQFLSVLSPKFTGW